MGKYETIKQLISVWEAAKKLAGPYRLRAENYADGYADGLKEALALYEEPPNQEVENGQAKCGRWACCSIRKENYFCPACCEQRTPAGKLDFERTKMEFKTYSDAKRYCRKFGLTQREIFSKSPILIAKALSRAFEAGQKPSNHGNTTDARQPGEGYGNCSCGTEGCCQCNPW